MFSFLFVYFSVKSLILHIFLIIMIIIRCSGMFRVSLFLVRWFEESCRTKFNAKNGNQTEDDLM